MAEKSYQDWVSNQLFSFNFFLIIIVNAIFYIIWFKLLDKSRISHLLLIGSSSAVFYLIGDMIVFGFLGLAEFKVSLTPLEPPVLILSVTIAPLIIMLVQQYKPSWGGYLLWTSIGMAFLAFVILPIYSVVGIFQLHNWNYFYQFLYFIISALIIKVIYNWVMSIDQGHHASGN